MQKLLEAQYSSLCTQLGHLISNKEKIDEQIKKIKDQIAGLDEISGQLKEAEAKAAQARIPRQVCKCQRDLEPVQEPTDAEPRSQ